MTTSKMDVSNLIIPKTSFREMRAMSSRERERERGAHCLSIRTAEAPGAMTATTAVAAVEDLISIASQRLNPHALQRLSIAEILGEHGARTSALALPTKEELGVPQELEPAYNRLVKFARLHEPTGYENDISQKHDAVRFLCLKEMLQASREAKLPHIQALCFERIVQWFDGASHQPRPANGAVMSASTPILPPRMSPKKKTLESNDPTIPLTIPNNQGPTPNGSSGVMLKAAISQKLEKYKMPDLRGSHIRRVAQLKSQGIDVPEDDDEVSTTARPEADCDDEGILDPLDYIRRDQRAKIRATFKSYEPETEAEFALNQIWLERTRAEEIEKQKEQFVRGKVRSWSMSKSRDESEYLRKQEAVQLAAGLDKFVEGEIEMISQPRRRNIERKKQEWQQLQPSGALQTLSPDNYPSATSQSGRAIVINQTEGGSTPTRALNHDSHLLRKKKLSSTSAVSGGMHYRNQLPANYTPQSKRSNGTPTSFSSKSSSTPTTPLSSSSSGKLKVLDDALPRANGLTGGYIQLSESPQESDESPAVGEDQCDSVDLPYQSLLKFSERIQESQRQLRFEPFHSSSHIRQLASPLSRAVSAPVINYKIYPRGTIPPQPEPADPEYRHLHIAATSRKPPVRITIFADKSVPVHGKPAANPKATTRGNNHLESILPTRPARFSSNLTALKKVVESTGNTLSKAASDELFSDFRVEQMQEVERIRALFEQHHVSLPSGILERGLFVPEDRTSLECAQNLPLPGSRLLPNPLLQVKIKTKAAKKKKKKKKKKKAAKGGVEKSKSKASAGDRTKSPTKRKRK